MAKLRLNMTDTWFLNARWEWEKTGQIHVLTADGVRAAEVAEVSRIIRVMLQEFGLPISVPAHHTPELRTEVLACIDQARSGRQVDEDRVVLLINQRRLQSKPLAPALVVLLNPEHTDPFGRPDEKERGIYGVSFPEGLCLLRCYRKEPVRHELAHMLGLGQHCTHPRCVMRWECPTSEFCAGCVQRIKTICQVHST